MKKPKKVSSAFGQYEIGESIGQGGSGYVYKATDDSGSLVAIKLLDPQKATRDNIKRFKNEYVFCSKNQHPNIIKVSDYGLTEDSIPFFVMELYDYSLRALIKTIDSKNILELYSNILNGVEAAHLKIVIHRDLKPENILIKDSGKKVAVSDFGIARFTQEELYTAIETSQSDRLANFQYAAPEQRMRNKKVDNRADIYALGLILNELFTKQLAIGVNYKIISSVSSNHAYLDPIVAKMLQQDPDNRYNSIDDIKKEMIMFQSEFISRQKLSQLESTVIPKNEIDDPLVNDPIRIIGYDWDNNVLTIKLNQKVNAKWIEALKNMGSYSFVHNKGPDAFNFSDSNAIISAYPHEVKDIIKHFKNWLPIANGIYEQNLLYEKHQREDAEKSELKKKIDMENQRIKVLKELKEIT
jgi:serine/threonine protein kinase